jgi:hypothetical protein
LRNRARNRQDRKDNRKNASHFRLDARHGKKGGSSRVSLSFMTRRLFAAGGAGLAFAGQSNVAAVKNAILELRYIRMRNSAEDQMRRNSDFLEHVAGPALERAGVSTLGFFAPVIAEESPFLLILSAFPSLAAMDTAREKEAQDPEYKKGRAAHNALAGQSYVRLDSSLLRCFDGMPAVAPPPARPEGGAHIFELRMYESDNASTLARKIAMFNEAEIGIFQRLGMRPVFFAETIVGGRMPNLVYMLSFDDLAAREKLWKAFGADPEWQKLSSRPGNSNNEIVSNITNSILRPLAFSRIK